MDDTVLGTGTLPTMTQLNELQITWENHFTSLNLSLLICVLEVVISTFYSFIVRLKSDNAYKSALESCKNLENINYGYYCPLGSVLMPWK